MNHQFSNSMDSSLINRLTVWLTNEWMNEWGIIDCMLKSRGVLFAYLLIRCLIKDYCDYPPDDREGVSNFSFVYSSRVTRILVVWNQVSNSYGAICASRKVSWANRIGWGKEYKKIKNEHDLIHRCKKLIFTFFIIFIKKTRF